MHSVKLGGNCMKKFSKRLLSVFLVIAVLIPTGALMIQSNATDNTYNVGDIIAFGTYPQTQVTDSTLISALNSISVTWKSYGYMSGSGTGWCDGSAKESDYMKYKDVTYNNERYRAVLFSTYRSGFVTYKSTETCYNFQQSNDYNINNIYWFKFEPLKWKILDSNKGLLLCDSIIDSQSFNNNLYSTGNTSTWSGRYWKNAERSIPANDYINSDIKKWLNDDFYYTAFSEANRNVISTQSTGNLFLLTENDTKNTSYGFVDNNSRIAYGTDYAKAQGLRVVDGTSIWMTQTAASTLGINISCVHFDGHTFGRESNDYGHTQMTFHGVRPAINVDLNELAKMQEKEHFPAGYDPNEDCYGFSNLNTTISIDFYKKIYGDVKGENLHKKYEKEKHGHCFGMANTTASFVANDKLLNTFSYLVADPDPDDEINEEKIVTKDNLKSIIGADASLLKSSEFGITLIDYIQYVHITQYSSEVINTHESTENNLQGLYNAVLDFVNGNGQAVGIYLYTTGLFNTKWEKHEVLAVGISEEKDGYHIKINDSNNFHTLTDFVISKDFSTWKYEIPGKKFNSGADYYYGSDNGGFCYGYWADLAYDTGWNVGHTDSNRRLVVVSEDVVIENNVTEIPDSIGNGTSTETTESRLYWLDENVTSAKITALSDNTEITISDVSSSVTATINEKASAQFNVDDNGTNSVTYSSNANDSVVITFVTADENGDLITTTLTGTANGDEVVASETEDGIQVTGLNDITVTYETADGTAETKADVKDGSTVNITVSDDENKVETDWQDKDETDEECKHPDTDHNGICDACSEDFTKGCSCNCHGNAFMQFLYKIATFFRRLFGMKQYQYCGCGKAHW